MNAYQKNLLILGLMSIQASWAEPLLNSWLTEPSGRYARIYRDMDDQTAQAPVTIWSRGAGTQSQSTYAGLHEISSNSTDVYIRTTGLGYHIMGPWFGENGNLFPNYPSNRAATFRFPRIPDTTISPKQATNLGTIGLFADGVSMFDSRDAFSYDTDEGVDETPANRMTVDGDGVWNRDAFVNESVTFDPAFAHQAQNNYHYHANPPALRHLLGDSVDYDASTHSYTENFNGKHSPILGWVRDGLPIYGPYAYSDPMNENSPVRRMISGYQKRDGSNGSTNLGIATGVEPANSQATGRTNLPAWATRNGRNQIAGNAQYGPPVSTDFPIGHYVEDYTYKGDLGLSLGTDFDLNEYNVRFCKTPEFPDGTWAYFTNIEADGTPVYPYNISFYYYASPTGGSVNGGTPTGTQIFWEGGPEKNLQFTNIANTPDTGDITLTWSSVEGGQYEVSRTETLRSNDWQTLALVEGADFSTSVNDDARTNNNDKQFYRVGLDSIQPFDDTGFTYDSSIISDGPQNNVLLLILDDWGIDASELYNSTSGAQLANMPNLRSLLFTNPLASPTSTPDKGLLFTRGYAQPICSPTRATILTGRQTYQHGVGNPTNSSTLPSSELTFPEIIISEAPDYGLASFGKWHLGSGDSGPLDTGGWPNFTGTLTGGLQDYNSWARIKIENGTLIDSGTNITSLVPGTYSSTYATSVQVDDARSFITSQGTSPWLVWMGFNAPHTPFHDPPASLAPAGGYSTSGTTNSDQYIRMLEALDTEIGRLLEVVDLDQTNIIVVGDNGTPGQVDQPPAGGLAGVKGSLNEGGIHVPFFATGPDVIRTGKSDKLVHVIDLFSTVLEIANVNVSAATSGIDIKSKSILPILNGSIDMEDRCIISEKFGLNASTDGRSLILQDWPQYKLISIQDVSDPNDAPNYQMYELGANGVEFMTLTTPPAPGDAWEDAYNALVAKDQSLVLAASNETIIYLEMPMIEGAGGIPNNANLGVDLITVDPDPNVSGDEFNATYIARFDQTDTYSKFWVKASVTDASTIDSLNSVITVDYPDNPNTGDPRTFDAIQIIIAP